MRRRARVVKDEKNEGLSRFSLSLALSFSPPRVFFLSGEIFSDPTSTGLCFLDSRKRTTIVFLNYNYGEELPFSPGAASAGRSTSTSSVSSLLLSRLLPSLLRGKSAPLPRPRRRCQPACLPCSCFCFVDGCGCRRRRRDWCRWLRFGGFFGREGMSFRGAAAAAATALLLLLPLLLLLLLPLLLLQPLLLPLLLLPLLLLPLLFSPHLFHRR